MRIRIYTLDLEGSVSNVVDYVVNLGGFLCIHIGEEPVVTNIGFNSPGQSQRAIFLGHIAKLSGGVRESTRGTLEHDLVLAHVLNVGSISLDWKIESLADTVKCLHWVNEVSLDHWVGRGSWAGVERVSVGEDFAIFANLV